MRFLPTLLNGLVLFFAPSPSAALHVTSIKTYNISNDVQGSVRLNGLAFQQHALTTFDNHQYIAFYKTADAYGKHHVNLGRRQISPTLGEWQYFAFTDYLQQTLDEHNTISMGISGDGRIHLSFDHHDVPLNYRVSTSGIATTLPTDWSASAFGGSVLHSLPGSTGPFTPLTYPRFERIDAGDLLMEFRIGQSGAGDSYLHRYSARTGQWRSVGKYLQGQENNAYINGISHQAGILYVSWIVRETPDPKTNHDFSFAYSPDYGATWKQSNGEPLTKPIISSTSSTIVFPIPQNSQLINQEAQCVGPNSHFHALMRDNTTGTPSFYHFLRNPTTGQFSKTKLLLPGLSTPPYLAYRGKLAATPNSALLAILPDAPASTVQVWGATAAQAYGDWTRLAVLDNMAGEPLVDEERLRRFGVLSLFVRQAGAFGTRKVQVWDFVVEEGAG